MPLSAASSVDSSGCIVDTQSQLQRDLRSFGGAFERPHLASLAFPHLVRVRADAGIPVRPQRSVVVVQSARQMWLRRRSLPAIFSRRMRFNPCHRHIPHFTIEIPTMKQGSSANFNTTPHVPPFLTAANTCNQRQRSHPAHFAFCVASLRAHLQSFYQPSMPYSKKQQAKESTVSTDLSAAAPTMPTAVTTIKGLPPRAATPKHELTKSTPMSTDYVSPLKKLKKSMYQKERRVIDTIDGLRDFIVNNDMSDPEIRASIRIQARLLFTASESIRGLHFLRLYLGEQHAPEPLHEQQKENQEAQHDDLFQSNQFLITLSLYEIAPDDPGLPPLGSVIAFTPTKLRLYRNCCQVDAKLQGIATAVPP